MERNASDCFRDMSRYCHGINYTPRVHAKRFQPDPPVRHRDLHADQGIGMSRDLIDPASEPPSSSEEVCSGEQFYVTQTISSSSRPPASRYPYAIM